MNDKIDIAIFTFLNRNGEVFEDELEVQMLKRFKSLTKEELWKRIDYLERAGKLGWFNGYLHSNYPKDYHESLKDNVDKFHNEFNPSARIIKCERCHQYVETNGTHCYLDSGNFHGNVCQPCLRIIEFMEALRSRKRYWQRMRSIGLDKLVDLEKPDKIVVTLTERVVARAGG